MPQTTLTIYGSIPRSEGPAKAASPCLRLEEVLPTLMIVLQEAPTVGAAGL